MYQSAIQREFRYAFSSVSKGAPFPPGPERQVTHRAARHAPSTLGGENSYVTNGPKVLRFGYTFSDG